MSRACILLILLMPMAGVSADAPATAVPFTMPVPDGWGTETLAFPLEFAPDLPYAGLEELRFSPGMFKSGAEDFWTFAFVWWIAADAPHTSPDLAANLELYLAGLGAAVAEARGIDASGGEYKVELSPVPPGRNVDVVGTAVTFDPFVTGQNLTLYVLVTLFECSEAERTAVLFEFSPQPFGHEVRQGLKAIREGFGCP